MEILSSIIGKFVEYAIEPIGRELGYLCFISINIEKLKTQVEMLKETRESVQHRVLDARRNAEDIKHGVENWLSKVDAIIERSEMILVNADQHVRLCSNLVQRHKLSKKAKKMAEELIGMKEEGNFNEVSYKVHVSSVENSLTKTPDFFNFESRKLIMKQIMDTLLDNSVKMIGVYGMGGVGKTMMVKEILRIIKEKKKLDEVIILTVSQTPDLKIIQGQLADMLGMELKEKTVQGRALKLHKRLNNMENNILIVVDDIWEHIDFETIGIPIVADHRAGSKLLFTSRDKHVLSNEMYIDKIFEIKVLEEDESWNLFKKIVGEIVETYDLKSIAIQIVKECGHLPIAITTVAKALRNKSSHIWEDALEQLKNPLAVNIREMDKKVYSSLKLSYDYLQGKEAKLLLLLCSMFPEDFPIEVEDLHVYAMAMGFLHGVNTVAKARRRIKNLVDDLISSSLLLQYSEYGNTFVKMHDLVRDVAILIASDDDQIRTLSYVNILDEWKEEKISGNHTAVYLNVEGLHSLPPKLMLPKVQLLMLQLNRSVFKGVHELAPTFFEETKEVKGLELQFMKASIFPSSLDSFANVRLLHLIGCELENIDMIGELRKLEILSFKESNIIQIPLGISQLTQLKVFDLSSCHQLRIIPANILSKLIKLEELYLETFSGWEGEELNKEAENASLSELRYLPRLCRLSLCIPDEKIMPKKLFSRELNLEMFKISIGTKIGNMLSDYKLSRTLVLEMESGSFLDDWIKMVLKRCEELQLVGSIGARVLTFELVENECSHLKHLHLFKNREFQHLIHQQNKPLRKTLSNLEDLQLSRLENLESIIDGHVTEFALNKLRSVHVECCDKMGTLFYNCILDDISNLESIRIWECEMLEYVIAVTMESKETTATIEFPHLKYLELDSVPRVRGFCSKMDQIGNESSFFTEKVLLPNLENLTITWADNLKMIWHNVLVPNSFSKLEGVEIESCNNIEKVFPPNIMSVLSCLKDLTIRDCKLLKCIFDVQEANTRETSIDLLSNLRHLELYKLPSLEYVWSKDSCELLIFKNTKVLSIQKCPKLKRAYPIKFLKQQEDLRIDFNQLKETPEKAKLSVHSNQFQTFQAGTTQLQDGLELFSKLKSLELYGSFENNSTHLPIEILQILHNLETFKAGRMFIKEIFPNERLMNVEEQKINTRFEPLELDLSELPKLTHFWKDEFESSSSLQNLNSLTISRCGILDMLVPSSVSFTNLNNLTLDKCHRLTHLLSPSVAKTLVQLTWLCLKECKRMTTIIAREVVEEGNDEIVFHKLTNLELGDLSKLTSFHSGKCTIRFPCLEDVDIESCPEMKAFSPGITSTPKLLVGNINIEGSFSRYGSGSNGHVNTTEVVEDINGIIRQVWEDDYDDEIQYLFTEIKGSYGGYGDSNGYANTDVVEDINCIIQQVWKDKL